MRIKLIEPFFTGSHSSWAEGLQQHSKHDISIASLSGNHWKWRMHGSAISLSSQIAAEQPADLILCTDMLDVATFKGLLPKSWAHVPIATYFHENQLAYPRSPTDPDSSLQRDHHYGWINYTSALCSDHVLFNSQYNHDSFLDALPAFLRGFPDHQNLETIDVIRAKSRVLHLGVDFKKFDKHLVTKTPGLIVWNHRWEFDKNPEEFFETLFELDIEGVEFKLAVCGQQYGKSPSIFREAQERLNSHIVHFGTMDRFEDYARLLWSADVVPVTSNQDFFGISAVEAIHCACKVLLPNRLAFPEHVGQSEWLYEAGQLKDRLKGSLDSPTLSKPIAEIGHYDWMSCISVYDDLLGAMCL